MPPGSMRSATANLRTSTTASKAAGHDRPRKHSQPHAISSRARDIVTIWVDRISAGLSSDAAICLIIPCSSAPTLSNNIIQKGLAFGRDWSGTVANSERVRMLRDPAPPAGWPWWGFGGAAPRRHEPNGGSQCQSLRKSDQLHHRQRRSLRQSPRNNPLPTPRVSRLFPARNNLA
jgi:hypothetical protein